MALISLKSCFQLLKAQESIESDMDVKLALVGSLVIKYLMEVTKAHCSCHRVIVFDEVSVHEVDAYS
jgi:hypothetical protein